MTKTVNIQVTNRGAVYIDNTRITGRNTKWGVHNIIFETDAPADQVSNILADNGYGHIELDVDYAKEAGVV